MNKGSTPQNPVWDIVNKVTINGIIKAECKNVWLNYQIKLLD